MIFAKLFDSFTAAAFYFLDPARFALQEYNEITRKAFLYGEWGPYFVLYAWVFFLLMILPTYLLSKSKKCRGKYILPTLPFAWLGISYMWGPTTAAITNITRGIFSLKLGLSELGLVYTLISTPIAWVLTRHGWGVKDLKVWVAMMATIAFLSFIMFTRVI